MSPPSLKRLVLIAIAIVIAIMIVYTRRAFGL
jgi:hypothetical protein